MSRILLRPSADDDLLEIYQHFCQDSGVRVAERFVSEAGATLTRLAGMPGLGTAYDPGHAVYAELRFIPVSRYRNYLVFYRPIAGGIEVLRVLHGARDLSGPLGQTLDITGQGEPTEG